MTARDTGKPADRSALSWPSRYGWSGPGAEVDADDLHRRRLVQRIAVTLGVGACVGLLARLALAPIHPASIVIVVGCVLGFFMTPVILRARDSPDEAGAVLVATLAVLMLAVTYVGGGLMSTLLVGVPLLTLVATVLLGLRSGVITTLFVATYFVVVGWLHLRGHSFPQEALPLERDAIIRGLLALVTCVLVTVMAAVVDAERRRWRQTLAAREAAARGFVDNNPVAMYVADDRGRLLGCNPAFLKLFGFGSFDIARKEGFRERWVDPYERGQIESRLRHGEAISGLEVRLQRVDGAEVWGLLNERIMVGDGEMVFEGSILDVTSSREVRRESDERERQHRFVVDTALGLIWTSDETGVVRFVNEQGVKIFGWPREQLVGRSFRELLSDQSREQVDELRRQVEERGETDGRLTIVTRSGRHRTIDVRILKIDSPDGTRRFLGHGKDVTEQIEAEGDLEQRDGALTELSAIAQSSSVGVRERVESLLELAHRRLGADRAALLRIQDDAPAVMSARPAGLATYATSILPSELWVEALREPIVVGDVARSAWADHSGLKGVGALLTAPVLVWGVPYGVLLFARSVSSASSYRKGQAELARLMALWLGTALEQEGRIEEAEELSRLGHLLAGCSTVDEAFEVTSRSLPRLFPDAAGGALLDLHPVERTLRAVSSWGDPITTVELGQTFGRDGCWSVRTGREYVVERAGEDRVTCEHVQHGPPMSFLCIPLRVGEEVKGVFHLQAELGRVVTVSVRLLADRVAARLALTLSNLELREQLREQSIRDGLTEVFNRRYFDIALDRECRRAVRAEDDLSVVLFDLDAFKAYNDSLGHQEGDRALREVARAAQGCLRRTSDLLARYGGEEFAVILPGASSEQGLALAEALRRVVEGLRMRHPGSPHEVVTISVGVATGKGEELEHPGRLVRRADGALYRAKQGGRNAVCSG